MKRKKKNGAVIMLANGTVIAIGNISEEDKLRGQTTENFRMLK